MDKVEKAIKEAINHIKCTHYGSFSEETVIEIKHYFLENAPLYKLTFRKTNDFLLYAQVFKNIQKVEI